MQSLCQSVSSIRTPVDRRAVCARLAAARCRLPAHLVLGLGLGWLKGAGEDGNLDILQLLGHLWVAHVLVNDDAIHQLGILQLATYFAIHLHRRKHGSL